MLICIFFCWVKRSNEQRVAFLWCFKPIQPAWQALKGEVQLLERGGASRVREFPLPLLTPVTLSEYHYSLKHSLKLLKGAQTHKRLLVSYNAHKQPFINLLYSYICISIVIRAEYPRKWSSNKAYVCMYVCVCVCVYVCKELCLCCFLTVSGQISAILSSFDGLVFHLLSRGQEKTRLFYTARTKSSKI